MYRLAGLRAMPVGDDLSHFAAALLDLPEGTDWLEVSDKRRGVLRVAAVFDDLLARAAASRFIGHHAGGDQVTARPAKIIQAGQRRARLPQRLARAASRKDRDGLSAG